MPKLKSALAAVSWSWATVRGISASRDGRCIAEVLTRKPAITKISQTLGSSRNAFQPSTAVSSACAMPSPTRSRRRSTWSARAPPYKPKTTSGTSSTRPIAPTAKFDPVSV